MPSTALKWKQNQNKTNHIYGPRPMDDGLWWIVKAPKMPWFDKYIHVVRCVHEYFYEWKIKKIKKINGK